MPSYVVTGASRGLGYTMVTHLATTGNTVVGLVRDKSATEARLSSDDTVPMDVKKNITYVQSDITNWKSLQSAAKETASITGGGLDVLINNAALVEKKDYWTTLFDQEPTELEHNLEESFHINVVGVAHTINAFLPLIRKGTLKKVMTLTTGLSDIALTKDFDLDVGPSYSISKAATNMLVAKYHAALGKSEGILFLGVSPGVVDTSEGVPPTEEDMAGISKMMGKFAAYEPNMKMLTPQESVEMQLAVLEKAVVEKDGGDFVSHFGNKRWL